MARKVTSTTPASRRQLASEQRRLAIIQAGLMVFAAQGFAATRLDDVAEKAGVAKGTIYLFFEDKEQLFEQIIIGAAAPVLEKVKVIADGDSAPIDAMLAAMFEVFRTEILGTERREIARLVLTEGGRFPRIAEFYHREIISKMLGIVRLVARRAHERGELSSDAIARFPHLVFAPMVMSSVAVGILWQIVFNPSIGLIDPVLNFLKLPTPSLGWLGDPKLAIYSILFVACWQYTGFMMVILLAGMQSVPSELYEAATLDGATETQSFFYITIPVMRNVIVAAVLITMIGSFKAFDLVYVLTLGGPANASEVLGTYLYKNAFNLNRMGYASTIAVVLLVFTVLLSLAQLRFQAYANRPSEKDTPL